MPTKKNKDASRAVAYHIKVSVDKKGNFTYKANGKDASMLAPNLGDTVSWSVKKNGRSSAFQVDFYGIAPFSGGAMVFRSLSKETPPQTVALLPHYHGNLVFKYSVSLPNGWYDDPVIGPVPVDPLNTFQNTLRTQVIKLSADNQGNLTITAPAMPLVKGAVSWQWDPQSAFTDDFVLTFKSPVPPGWPAVTDSQSQLIVLNFETVGNDSYTINTVNTGLSASSTLIIA